MSLFTGLFDLLAIPLGWLLSFIYKLIPNYFLAIFIFTVIARAAMFPLSLKSQKSQADRAKLAPRLDRLKKKYEKDPKKFQQKQQELFEKEGVSLTGGCLPMLVQMLVLFGIISVIYSPLTHIARFPSTVVTASANALTEQKIVNERDLKGYYKELRILQNLDGNEKIIEDSILKIGTEEENGLAVYSDADAKEYYDEMITLRDQFSFFGGDMLANPWDPAKGFKGISIVWLIPLLSGLTALLSSLVSMHYNKQMTSAENQPGQGCSNAMLMVMMPAFSLFIAFSVPGGVGIYWICSNIIALVQTVILNSIYNPAKIRAQAEIEYEERRRQKQEDKKRLAEARAQEQRELALQQKQEEKKPSKKKEPEKKPDEETKPESGNLSDDNTDAK